MILTKGGCAVVGKKSFSDEAADSGIDPVCQFFGFLPKVQFPVAVRTKGYSVINSIRSTVGELPEMMDLKKGFIVNAIEGGVFAAAFTDAPCLTEHPCFHGGVTNELACLGSNDSRFCAS